MRDTARGGHLARPRFRDRPRLVRVAGAAARPSQRLMTRFQAVAVTLAGAVLAVVLLNVFLPQPFGPFALGAIFEPYLVVVGVLAGVVGLRSRKPVSRLLLVALIGISLLRYIPAWVSFPAPPTAETLQVSAWNLHDGQAAARRVLQGVFASDADIIALAELGPDSVAALQRDARSFEFKALTSESVFLDVGLLSVYPILETERSTSPPFLRAVIQPPTAEPIVVYAIHAPLGRYVSIRGIPVSVDLSVRDAAMAVIRDRIEQDLAQERSVIVLGDFNTTERELAYALIASGLRDAHLDAGMGPGLTWRPGGFLPFGVLRIDYVMSTPDLQATSSTVDCSLSSDHCRVDVELSMNQQVSLGTGI